MSTEYASGPRDASVFPRSWGRPPWDLEERAAWIKRNVAATAGVAYLRRLERHDIQFINTLRRAELERRRVASQ